MADFFDKNGCQPVGANSKLSATSSSQSAALPLNSSGKDYPAKFRIITGNPSTAKYVYIQMGAGTQTANAGTSTPILVNSREIFRAPPNADSIGYITDAGTADLHVQAVNGD